MVVLSLCQRDIHSIIAGGQFEVTLEGSTEMSGVEKTPLESDLRDGFVAKFVSAKIVRNLLQSSTLDVTAYCFTLLFKQSVQLSDRETQLARQMGGAERGVLQLLIDQRYHQAIQLARLKLFFNDGWSRLFSQRGYQKCQQCRLHGVSVFLRIPDAATELRITDRVDQCANQPRGDAIA
ncbi:hypothetical protein ASC85_01715 [Pseudomonas sp. Root401]|nr:hypothetical protein ASC85_01715 [Pseudomonas sp. Root401]